MSETESGTGWGVGCAVAAIVGGLVLVLAVAALGLLFFRSMSASEPMPVGVAPPPPPPRARAVENPVVIHDETEAADTVELGVAAVEVKLTGLGEGGTWYMIGQDIYEGDAALKEAVAGRLAAAGKKGRTLRVEFVVQTEAGITAKHVEAARRACEAAGAVFRAEERKP